MALTEQELMGALAQEFNLAPAKVTMTAQLHEDLDFDSVGMLDLIIFVEEMAQPSQLVDEVPIPRTVSDLVGYYNTLIREP